MKAFKVDLSDYQVKTAATGDKEQRYQVRQSLRAMLTHAQRQMSAVELLEAKDLADRIRDCGDGEILLDTGEYAKLREALNAGKGYTEADAEFIKRVLQADEVDMQEAS